MCVCACVKVQNIGIQLWRRKLKQKIICGIKKAEEAQAPIKNKDNLAGRFFLLLNFEDGLMVRHLGPVWKEF